MASKETGSRRTENGKRAKVSREIVQDKTEVILLSDCRGLDKRRRPSDFPFCRLCSCFILFTYNAGVQRTRKSRGVRKAVTTYLVALGLTFTARERKQ